MPRGRVEDVLCVKVRCAGVARTYVVLAECPRSVTSLRFMEAFDRVKWYCDSR
jgi:hypothetical protein